MDCKFTVKGIKLLCDALKENKTLVSIHMSGNIMGDDGATILATCLQVNRSLKYVSCDDCMISDVGALALYQIMQRNQGVIVTCTRFNQVSIAIYFPFPPPDSPALSAVLLFLFFLLPFSTPLSI
jgi:Ran GTPase-activating protein (RanGAP) involved in mRNA processing and transport